MFVFFWKSKFKQIENKQTNKRTVTANIKQSNGLISIVAPDRELIYLLQNTTETI